MAEALAGRGYALVLHYHTSATEAEASAAAYPGRGTPAIAIGADLTDAAGPRGLISRSLDQFGRLDVLVNCAAIWQSKRLEDVTADDVRRHFDTNALGTFICAEHAGLHMVAQPEGGCIINLGDWAEVRPYLNYAAYFLSKGAVSSMTRCLAVELGSATPMSASTASCPAP